MRCCITRIFLNSKLKVIDKSLTVTFVFVVITPSWVNLKVLPSLYPISSSKSPHTALTQRVDWRRGWPAAHLPSRINGGDVRLPPPLTTSPFSAISADSHAPIRNRLAVTRGPMATSETGLESITKMFTLSDRALHFKALLNVLDPGLRRGRIWKGEFFWRRLPRRSRGGKAFGFCHPAGNDCAVSAGGEWGGLDSVGVPSELASTFRPVPVVRPPRLSALCGTKFTRQIQFLGNSFFLLIPPQLLRRWGRNELTSEYSILLTRLR